ncbi:uncharacterized protein LOC126378527 [Pectinophora gossypiella]|uniref:uncharacterized protein LOC126378527 n=1 Tax=Pectinophora gossypiella TaxID=13191 RepID=UPI00214F1FEF|nr:uncharacterized protein LOC126378527 [Pectinophora gossypiella]
MIKLFAFFAFGVAVCAADAPVSPPVPPPVLCGEIPKSIFSCLGIPTVIAASAGYQCRLHASECDKMKCIFEKSGWMDGDKVNKQKVIDHFNKFANDHPAWSTAVEQVKTACLSGTLPAQGVYLDCPAYDVMNCALASFIKSARPSQWASIPECKYPQDFARACPICPNDCFAPQVPYGSCNACVLLPRTP